MSAMKPTCLMLIGALLAVTVASTSMPAPFSRELKLTEPAMAGQDVYLAREFLIRFQKSLSHCSGVQNCTFNSDTATALAQYQKHAGLQQDGIIGPATASAMLAELSFDRYTKSNATPASLGYKYMIAVHVHRNRSIEDHAAQLISANGTVLLTFTVRAHGAISDPPPPWPNFNSGPGRNEFSSDGNTPTGLFECDLNSPEDDPAAFGKWPVNRAVRGLSGNAKITVNGAVGETIRDGILVHTGEWDKYGWSEPNPMPNSEGCIHSWPEYIESIWKFLVAEGVSVNPNTGGKLPYPYKCQGLLSVELVDPPPLSF